MAMQPLKLPPGVVRSSTPAMSRGRYWDTNLVRWRGGALLPVGGWQRITDIPLPTPARRLHCWRDLDDIERVVACGDLGVYVMESSVYTDRTMLGFVAVPPYSTKGGYGIGLYSAGLYGTERGDVDSRLFTRPDLWSADNFGEILLCMNSGDGRLCQWNPSTVPHPARLTPVTNAPVSSRAFLVTEERHVMLFGAGGLPYRVAWCDRENLNDWDFASITNTAGFLDLSISGWIVAAIRVRGGVLIFTDASVWLASYIGMPSIYSFQKIGEHCSLFSPYSVASYAGGAVWLGREGFWRFDGGQVLPVPSDLSDYLLKVIDPPAGATRVNMASNGLYPEVWGLYPSVGKTECDRYWIWNWAENWWALGRLDRSAMLASGVAPFPLKSSTDGHLYYHEYGWDAAGATRIGNVWAETGPLAAGGGGRIFQVAGGQLDTGLGYGGSQLTAITSYAPDGAEYVCGPFTPRPDGWLDARFSGRDARLRISATVDGAWSVGEIRLDIRPGGER